MRKAISQCTLDSEYGDTTSENDAIEATMEAFAKAQMLVLVKVKVNLNLLI